ncbi:MAG: HXXEE domain-containing protein [Candidatus Nanopelagicales bacterium]
MSTTTDHAWAATLALLATHQMEEMVFSLDEWRERIGGTGMPRFDRFVQRTPIGRQAPGPRIATIVGQSLLASGLYAATRRSVPATRAVTTALTVGWAGAFVMHLSVAARTRSAMPGLATSIFPGLPGAVWVVRYIWS